MKRIFLFSAIATMALVSCNSTPKADEAKTEEQQDVALAEGDAYKIDPSQTIQFIGTKPVGQHHGTFNITEGEFFVKNDAIVTGGKLSFDINSLQITDADTSGAARRRRRCFIRS